MAEDVKKFLARLYPDADMTKGIDFDRSGAIESDEAVSDFNRDGEIDDIDYAILTFMNRDHFIDKHGAKKWREFERLWDKAAKKMNSLFHENPPTTSANSRRREEVIQGMVINERFDGRFNELNEAQAREVVETQKAMEELNRRYPSIPLDNIKPSDAKRMLASMREIERFNPKLAANIERIAYNIDGYKKGDNKWLYRVVVGGYASGREVHINQFLDSDSTAVHEAAHCYHHTVEDEDQRRLIEAEWKLNDYIDSRHRVSEYDLDDGSPIVFLPHFAAIDKDYRDIVEDNLAKRERGEVYDEKLVGLYERWKSVREGSFDYRWNHVNQAYTHDSDFEDVEAAGKKLEAAERDFERIATEVFGESGKDPFWFDTFYEGGDRKRPIFKGSIMKKTSRCRDAAKKERVEAAMRDVSDAAHDYRLALYDRFASRTVSTSWPIDASLFWKSTSPLGPGEGHADPYGATNNMEAVATFVQYVYDNGELPYRSNDVRHNRMVKNYARILRDREFIRPDHPAVSDV